MIISLLVIIAVVISMFLVSRWYTLSEKSKPKAIGVTFIPEYAQLLGLNPEQTMDALIHELNIKHFRLVSYWDTIQPRANEYDFKQLDWQFQKAESAHAKISLAIGLRQPRWPECHSPNWIDTSKSQKDWQPQLEAFMKQVINRYKFSPALDSYQLENEYYNHFGSCYNFDRTRLESELALTKRLDPVHPVLISRSNNYVGLMLRQPLPDIIGISVYRRVWDSQITHRYFQYPYPAWYYGFLAGGEKLLTGKDSILHEMQAEPWPPNGQDIKQITLEEQNKSFNAVRFKDRIAFANATGMREIYYWGAEYWYYRKTILHDDSVWNVAQKEFNSQFADTTGY